jgi:hypothetical protein
MQWLPVRYQEMVNTDTYADDILRIAGVLRKSF